jgi:uncharacterized protein YceK
MKRLIPFLLLAAFALSGCGSVPPYGQAEPSGSPWTNDPYFTAPPT